MTDIWNYLQEYPLKAQYPNSDRHLIEQVPLLRQLTKFEQDIGVEFQHIRMLAQAFCTRPIPQNDLTIEDNERLEFLGKSEYSFILFDFVNMCLRLNSCVRIILSVFLINESPATYSLAFI